MNARWYPAPERKQSAGRPPRPKQAIIVLPQWNSDAISHNVLCTLFNRFGISALRLSQPYHDIRRPAELERSDYAVSANIGRTTAACRQAVVDIRSCIDWLETQSYTQFGVLGTSLGSCYAFIAAAHDPRLRVCAFNHASTWFGDVVWEGQSTRHVRAALEESGLTQDQVRQIFLGVSPMSYMQRFAATPKRVLVVHATYDLTFPLHLSLEVLKQFQQLNIDFVSKVLPLRPLHHRRDPLQVHRRMVSGIVHLPGVQGPRGSQLAHRALFSLRRTWRKIASMARPLRTKRFRLGRRDRG